MSQDGDGFVATIGLVVTNPHPQPLSRGERGAGRWERAG
jgi:hypothetical protein